MISIIRCTSTKRKRPDVRDTREWPEKIDFARTDWENQIWSPSIFYLNPAVVLTELNALHDVIFYPIYRLEKQDYHRLATSPAFIFIHIRSKEMNFYRKHW